MASDESQQQDPSSPRPAYRLNAVPAPAVRRLSLYLRTLEEFLKQDRKTTSSKELGEALGYTDTQVRKDLAYFGQFGHPGIGYPVDELIARIRRIFGTDRIWNVLVVGAGNLGQALATYPGFNKKGFEIAGICDNDPAKIGRRIGPAPGLEILPVERLSEIVTQRNVQIGAIAVPVEVTQEIADALVAAGIKGILNFAPTSLTVPDNIPLASVELAGHLEQLASRINAQQVSGDK